MSLYHDRPLGNIGGWPTTIMADDAAEVVY